MEPLLDKFNLITGTIVAALSFIFGDHWILFAGFLVLNVADYATGMYRSRILHTSSSEEGAKGIWKKVTYWIVIAAAFGVTVMFAEIGTVLGYDLSFVQAFGWITLATYIINEFRSILENLVEAGTDVPDILIRGLKVAGKIVDQTGKEEEAKEDGANPGNHSE